LNIRKAVILAAGYGTRFLPATKAVPKEMLPLYDRPVIDFIVEEALAAGLDQIVMVTSRAKRAVEDYFDRDFELESVLAKRPKVHDEMVRIGDIEMAFVRQKERRGQAHAILGTRRFIGDEPFALFYPDDVIFSAKPAIGQLLDVAKKYDGSVLAVQRVSKSEIVHYGAIESEPVEERVHRVHKIIEKPRPEEAQAGLGTVGRYVLTSDIWPLLEKTPETIGGEMFLTDTLSMLMDSGKPVFACEYEGTRFDTGRPLGLLKASIHVALHDAGGAGELRAYLRAAAGE
jgi:UTP--glucose-1-phosphate uridylyltransferase